MYLNCQMLQWRGLNKKILVDLLKYNCSLVILIVIIWMLLSKETYYFKGCNDFYILVFLSVYTKIYRNYDSLQSYSSCSFPELLNYIYWWHQLLLAIQWKSCNITFSFISFRFYSRGIVNGRKKFILGCLSNLIAV